MQDLVAIARIVRPRGLLGECIAEILTDFPERFDGLKDAVGLTPAGDRLELKIESFWFQKGRVVLKFAGFDTVETAETLRGCEVCVDESEAVKLDEGEYFDWQLEGCEVVSVEGKPIGTVRELMRTGGTEILVVDGTEKEYLIPFAETICLEVDVEKKQIVVDPPEGLLEF
jgi:16S rRNA processing protein RimM